MSALTTNLRPCPFCSGVARFCQDAEHECHYIVCTGCGLSADFGPGVSDDHETVAELQAACADKWNLRVD